MLACQLLGLIHTKLFFFFNDTATTEIYTLSLHDALPISRRPPAGSAMPRRVMRLVERDEDGDARLGPEDRKSTRLNSSHSQISYAVFCLKKKYAAELCFGITATTTSANA